jgi:hypothetical protein
LACHHHLVLIGPAIGIVLLILWWQWFDFDLCGFFDLDIWWFVLCWWYLCLIWELEQLFDRSQTHNSFLGLGPVKTYRIDNVRARKCTKNNNKKMFVFSLEDFCCLKIESTNVLRAVICANRRPIH